MTTIKDRKKAEQISIGITFCPFNTVIINYQNDNSNIDELKNSKFLKLAHCFIINGMTLLNVDNIR